MSWKYDQTVYDRDRWMASSGIVHRLADGSVAFRIHGRAEQSYLNDIYSLASEDVVVRSTDLGLSWERYDGELPGDGECHLRDGATVVEVVTGGARTLAEKRQAVAEAGGNPESVSEFGYDLWPESARAEIEAAGLYINGSFPGIFGTLSTLSVRRSTDGGRTFTSRPLTELPQLARTAGSFRRVIELRDGTLLGACMGRRERESGEMAYAVRSTDSGESWTFHPIAEDAAARHQWPETSLIELADGRVLAMHRHHARGSPVGDNLWQNFSADGGVTWSEPEELPIWGYPPHLITLADGALLVTYAHRRHPYGVRACVSRDLGRTWDVEHQKIIRDDSLPGLVWYPASAQLDDGTILTVYSLSKIPRVPYRPDDTIGPSDDLVIHARKRVGTDRRWWGGYHGYVAVSRYTPDYVRAPGQQTGRTMFDAAPASGSGTGHDEE